MVFSITYSSFTLLFQKGQFKPTNATKVQLKPTHNFMVMTVEARTQVITTSSSINNVT